MKRSISLLPCALAAGLLMLAGGCGKETDELEPTATPPAPKEAATQIQRAFTAAPPEVKRNADAASQALQSANYEAAVQSITAIRAKPNLTMEQGMAVYNTERSLEATLIARMDAGDQSAKRAYEMLKKARRN